MVTKIGMVSLGCSKNLVDSEAMLGILKQAGMEIVNDAESADVLVVNTCGFLQSAVEESLNTILDLAEFKEQGRCKALIVSGCLTQRYKDQLLQELPEVDAIVGTADLHRIAEVTQRVLQGQERLSFVGDGKFHYYEAFPRLLATPSYSVYVKLSEGCDHTCAFCIIPQLRGPHVSRPIESITDEVRTLAAGGAREINLIAQDSTYYGVDLYHRQRLSDLLRELNNVPGVDWLRLFYAYPRQLNDDIMRTMAELPHVCKYVDMPLQHGSDRILRAMGRPERRGSILKQVHDLRSHMPDVSLRSTFIVGFPGETKDDFQQLCDLVEGLQLDHVGVFKYSREPGTTAAELPNQVPEELKEERYNTLMQIQQRVSAQRLQRFVGRDLQVLVEGEAEYDTQSDRAPSSESPRLYYGRHQGQAPDIDGVVFFEVNGVDAPNPGDMVVVTVSGSAEYDLIGTL